MIFEEGDEVVIRSSLFYVAGDVFYLIKEFVIKGRQLL